MIAKFIAQQLHSPSGVIGRQILPRLFNKRNSADYGFPILKVNDFGHNCPNTVLPVGTKVKFDADTQEIEILEQCVKASSIS